MLLFADGIVLIKKQLYPTKKVNPFFEQSVVPIGGFRGWKRKWHQKKSNAVMQCIGEQI